MSLLFGLFGIFGSVVAIHSIYRSCWQPPTHVCMHVCMYVLYVGTIFMPIFLMQGRCFWMFLSCHTAAGLLLNCCEWDCYWLESGVLVLNLAMEICMYKHVYEMCLCICYNILSNAGEMKCNLEVPLGSNTEKARYNPDCWGRNLYRP